MTTDELKQKYADAETEITDIYTTTRAVSTYAYKAKTDKKTEAVFKGLRESTTKYCDTELGRIYNDSLKQVEADMYDEYGFEEDINHDRAAEAETVQNVKEDTESKLMFAILSASVCLAGYSSNSGEFDFSDVEGFRESILVQIANGGISGNAYFRDGSIVNAGLSNYADIVLQGAETELSNSAVMDTLMANGWDLVKMSYHYGACPLCVPYEDRVYSVSGTSDEYPYLYDTPWDETFQNFHPNCYHYLTPFIPNDMDEKQLERIQAFSNRSFEIGGEGWTKAQTKKAERNLKLYKKAQQRKSKIYSARKQYERYKAVLKDTPKTFEGFWKMKQGDTAEYHELMSEYRKWALSD